jgi:SAM-dependent methyltransferase/DNA-binding MarR family transcriptional regulator
MNGAELYFLGRRLMMIATESLPEQSVLRSIPPGARLVLEDAARYPGTTAEKTAERTGLLPEQVSALVESLAAQGFVRITEDPADPVVRRISYGRDQLFRDIATPVDAALAAALGTADAEDVRDVVATLESLARRLRSGAMMPGSGTDFDTAYQGTPPWEIGRPQPAFVSLAEAGDITGRVLDVGCGTGEHALLAAGLGLPAAGIDSSPTAIAIATRKAAERNLAVRFSVHDALDLGGLGEQFDTVLDSALFHVFSDDDRLRYVDGLRQVLPAGGRYFMLCFSDRQPPGFGPRRVRREEIEAAFADGWRIDEIEPATMEVTIDPAGVRAWRTAITRR